MDTEGNKITNMDAEGLASLARRYYAARFPNPQRLGCPPPGEIIKVVGRREIPDEALREHLFECSECFGEYRQALAQCRWPVADKSSWKNRLATVMRRVSSAGALKISSSAVLILSLLIILIWPRDTHEAGESVVSGSATSEPRGGAGSKDGAGVARAQATDSGVGIPKPTGYELAMTGVGILAAGNEKAAKPEKVDVDLDNFQVFRQALREGPPMASGAQPYREGSKLRGKSDMELYRPQSKEGEKIITLPPTLARMVLRLPETAAPGKYTVSLINAFGKSLLSTSAVSQDGSKLRVVLDLRRISAKKCRLRLVRNGEAPAFYDVIIGAK